MDQPRAELADLLRPRLKPPGFNDDAFLADFDRILDAGGMRRDAEAATGPAAPSATPTAPPTAPTLVLPAMGAGPIDPDIAMVDVDLLALVSPVPRAELAQWVGPIRKACIAFEINTVRRVAAFIAQMAHESGLKPRSENLNYSVEGLLKTFGRHRISAADAQRYGRIDGKQRANQEAIANCIYGGEWGRKNLGNTEPGDGWKMRGGGPLQNTGRANWQGFADTLGMTLDEALAYGRTLEGGIMAAAWFWETNDINRLADTPGVVDESKRINGGTNGLADRKAKFDKIVAEMLRRGA